MTELNKDILSIGGGNLPDDFTSIVVNVSGYPAPSAPVIVLNNVLWMRFTTDQSTAMRGFEVTVRAVTAGEKIFEWFFL